MEERMDDLQDGLGRRMDDCVTKMDKLTYVEEQQTKIHTEHIMDLQEVTTKERGQIHALEREVARVEEGRTAINQLLQELDVSFRNEMEEIRNNELASLARLFKEME